MSNDETNSEMDFIVPHPLTPVDRWWYPNLYRASDWLIAYPIEIIKRGVIEKATKMLKEEAKKFKDYGIKPFRNLYSGNCSLGVKLRAKNPTKEEIKKIYEAFEYLKNIEWPGGMDVHQKFQR